MKVTALWTYPVKSLAGQSLTEAELQGRGFVDDRRWMLVDENGRFISQREHAHLARWQAVVAENDLILRQIDTGVEIRVPDARAETGTSVKVQIWQDEVSARLVSTVPAAALRVAFGFPCQLVYMAEDSKRAIDPRYAKAGEEVSFADGYPYLIATTGSLAAIEEERGKDLDMRRFRPNIVIDHPAAFAEDNWQAITIGNQPFRLPKPCARCVVITIDPDTTVKDPEVFAAVAKLHQNNRKVLFGMNACWEGIMSGMIRIGDELKVEQYRS
ncbi:MAG: MOSC N-terminal beta barrel domain-containing protein [Bacteroidota bacterium]